MSSTVWPNRSAIEYKNSIITGQLIYISDFNLNKVVGHQNKHRPGTQTYQQYEAKLKEGEHISEIILTDDEILELIKRYAQTGTNIYDRKGNWTNKEKILDSDTTVGYVFRGDTKLATKSFMIVYAKKGIHIWPLDREGKNKWNQKSSKKTTG